MLTDGEVITNPQTDEYLKKINTQRTAIHYDWSVVKIRTN